MAAFIMNTAKALLTQSQNEDDVPIIQPQSEDDVPKEVTLVDTSKQSTNLPLDEKSNKDGDDDTAEVTENTSYTGDSTSIIEIQPWQKFTHSEKYNNIKALTKINTQTLHEAQGARKAAEKSADLGHQNLDINKQTLETTQANSAQLSDMKTTLEIVGKDKIEMQKQIIKSEKKAKKEQKQNHQLKAEIRRKEEENSRLQAQLFARDEKENKVNCRLKPSKDGKKASDLVKNHDKHVENHILGAGEKKAKENARKEGRIRH